MKKAIIFMKKNVKKIIFIVLTVILIILLYSYLTMNNYKLALYANSFDQIIESNLKIEFEESTGFYKITNQEDKDFKLLQLTDIHLGGSNASFGNDKLALNAMYKLIKYTEPDLIIITGDMLFSSILSRNVNNANAAIALKVFMEKIGIPWTITFGNHDYELYNTHDQSKIENIFSSDKNFLFNKAFYHDENAYSNQAIKLYNYDNTINTLILTLDSNELIKNESNSIAWYNMIIEMSEITEGKNVPSLLFLHMPLYEYENAWNSKNNDEVTYLYGEKREDICYEKKTNLFNAILEKESTKGIFCGHDHLNDFSLIYKGVRMTYGKSIDYITYKGIGNKKAQRGGTLIEIKNDSSFNVTPISLENIE